MRIARWLPLVPLMTLALAVACFGDDEEPSSSPMPVLTIVISSPTATNAGPGTESRAPGTVVTIKTSGDCLNLREQPSRDAAVIFCIPDGQKLTIVSGPVDAEGIRWWRAERVGFIGIGWVAGQFLVDPGAG